MVFTQHTSEQPNLQSNLQLEEELHLTKLLSDSIFPHNPKLNKVFDYIEANYHQPITLSNVAQAVLYSPAYLTDLVRRQTGKTVNNWIIERRMAEARRLLLETNQTASEIASLVGYQNEVHFFRQFRQYHEATPQMWRNLQRTKYGIKK